MPHDTGDIDVFAFGAPGGRGGALIAEISEAASKKRRGRPRKSDKHDN